MKRHPRVRAFALASLLGVLWHFLVNAGFDGNPIWSEPYWVFAGIAAGLAAGAFSIVTAHIRSLWWEVLLAVPTLAIGAATYWVVGGIVHLLFLSPGQDFALGDHLAATPFVVLGAVLFGWVWIPLAWGTRWVFLSCVRSDWCAA